MRIHNSIASLLCILILTVNSEIKSNDIDEMNNFSFNAINEDVENRITSISSFTPINDSIIVITDGGSRGAHFLNCKGDFINSIYPPLIFVDSIATNKIAASKFRGEYYRFLYLNEITYPPNSPYEGELFPDSLIENFIKRVYVKCNTINDSILCLSSTYEMFVQDMDPNEKKNSRGRENTPILVFYNYKNNVIENIEYFQHKNNLFPRTYSVKFNNQDSQIYAIVKNSNKGLSPDKIPFIVSFDGTNEFHVQKYFPPKLYKFANSLDLLAPTILFVEGNMFCTFRLLDEVYNLTENTSFKIQNLNNDNLNFLDSFNISNPSFEKINFTVLYFGLLQNQNLLLMIDCKKENDKHEYQIQEYSLNGKLIKSKSISKINQKIGDIISLVSLDNNNWIFGLSYSEENEQYILSRFEW